MASLKNSGGKTKIISGDVDLKKDGGNVYTSGASTRSVEDKSHQAISSYFIGPQAENLEFFKDNMAVIIEHLKDSRLNYFPEDGDFITKEIQSSDTFKKRTQDISKAIEATSKMLAKHSIPFWSPRYQGHMCTDMNMPALLSYFATMCYNPNNVAFEASPFTTLIEMEAGKQLCKMFSYKVNEEHYGDSGAWGHVTCGGTVANLESVWSARNLKFYPLSIRQALDGPLSWIADSFTIKTAQNENKLFAKLTTWELLNLKADSILDIPERLYNEYSISGPYLDKIMDKFGIQSCGKDVLERKFGIAKPPQYMVTITKHYSWPKAAAITGIGSDNVIGINVDNGARMDIKELEKRLEQNLKNEQPVYAVVAIIGSTEEGAVDRLGEVLAMRRRFQARGMSYLVHADAAWGGYFASMLPRHFSPGGRLSDHLPVGLGSAEGFVPDSSLRTETQEDMWWLRHADSITVDPHKAGYIPYPAGGLCYKDGRLRHLVTWTSPYLSQGSPLNIGVYGVEGSKPGASAVSTFLSNECIGLDVDGYGALLGEVSFSCSRLSAQWAAMTDDSMPFTVIPFNMLPSELLEGTTADSVEAERKWIRENILAASNLTIVSSGATSPGGDSALSLLRKLGSDLNINAFAVNFRNADGSFNADTEEANYLMQRVMQHFSIDSPADEATEIPMYLTSTQFSPALYGDCLKNFKRRLHLNPDDGHDLFVLRNVVMSPFPSEKDFISELANIFKKVVAQEVEEILKINEGSAHHEFLIHGRDDVFLVHKSSFHVANHRHQTILQVNLFDNMKWYQALLAQYPEEVFTFKTVDAVNLTDTFQESAKMEGYMTSSTTGPILPNFTLQIAKVLLNRPIQGPNLSLTYPTTRMPFYLYGTARQQHIEHALLCNPNIQLSGVDIRLTPPHPDLAAALAHRPLLLFLDDVREEAMQPFPDSNASLTASPSFFFAPTERFSVSIWTDPSKREEASGARILEAWEALGRGGSEKGLVWRGTLELAGTVEVDVETLNFDPYQRVDNETAWKKEFEAYLREVERR